MRTDIAPQTYPAASEPGLHPADFKSAYNLPATKGAGQIVAIVDAYDNPNIASDLKTYRAEFGLLPLQTSPSTIKPGSRVTTLRVMWAGAWRKISTSRWSPRAVQSAPSTLSRPTRLASAISARAEVEAVKLGAHIVSNSYGGSCSGSCGGYGSDYNSPGVVYLASAGDDGYFRASQRNSPPLSRSAARR